jgi:hypothetical protein
MSKFPYIGSSNWLAPLALFIDLRSADKFCVCDFLQFGFSYFLSEDLLQTARLRRAVDEVKFLTFIPLNTQSPKIIPSFPNGSWPNLNSRSRHSAEIEISSSFSTMILRMDEAS